MTKARRWQSPGVRGLEVWDLELDNSVLWDHMDSPTFATAVTRAVARLRSGHATSRSVGALPVTDADFDAVYFTGGRVADPQLREELRALDPSFRFCREPLWTSLAGAKLLLAHQQNPRRGLAIDLGQTSIKLEFADRRHRFPREFDQLRIRDPRAPSSRSSRPLEPPSADLQAQRSALRRFMARSLERAGVEGADGAVICLPCQFDEHGTPGSSSYVGMEGGATLITDLLAPLGELGDVTFLNDAEAAALGAVAGSVESAMDFLIPIDAQIPDDVGVEGMRASGRDTRTLLVLSLGFGVGGALVDSTVLGVGG